MVVARFENLEKNAPSGSAVAKCQSRPCHADVHMNTEYYGAPREAGAYTDSPGSSSQGYGSTATASDYTDYFENYRGDAMYPDFLKTYGHQKTSDDGSSSTSTNEAKIYPIFTALFSPSMLEFRHLYPFSSKKLTLSSAFDLTAPSKESSSDARKRILLDMDTDTLKTLLTLVRLDSGSKAVSDDEINLESAILDEMMEREGSGATGGTNSFVIDWNERFQELLASPDSLNKFAQLRNLANDFCFTAELYARIIISELYLPTSQKTIKPSSVGGVAGGQKFIVQGILFKFSVDVELRKASSSASTTNLPSLEPSSLPSTPQSSDLKSRTNSAPLGASGQTSIWMYGGATPSTEFAMKAAKHELRSTIAYFSTNTCRVPLVALVDFRGYRVLCSSMLPIDGTTICYGSSDAGKTIHADEDAAKLFDEAGAKLNLKKHKFKGVEVCAPVDIEGHHGHDGNMYCIDLARLFPPEAPPLALHAHSRAIFFRLLRPELVRQMPSPLSSDSFTNFGSDQASEHNADVLNATQYLQQTIVPQFGKWLCTSASTVNSFTSLTYHTHRKGINLRYLGLVRASISVPDGNYAGNYPRVYIPSVAHSHLSLNRSLESSESSITSNDQSDDSSAPGTPKLEMRHKDESTPLRSTKAAPAIIRPYATEEAVRQLILEEMVARVLKCMLRGQWRKRMQEVRICTETPFAEAVLDLLNIVTCKNSHSKQFWCTQIKAELTTKFCVGLSARELSSDYDLMNSIELQSLVERFCSLVGVQLDPHFVEVLTQANRPFLYTDLYGITSTIHHMNIIDFAEGQLLALTARKRDNKLRLQLLGMAEKKLTAAHASGTHISLSVVFELANVHYSQAMLLPLNQSTSNVVEAIRCYTSALQLVDASTPSTTIGKCHIRILRLFFEKLGSNVLLEETALQSQGISELSLAAHLNGAAVVRPKALRKIIVKATQMNEPEPSTNLRSPFLPDCSKTSAFGLLLTCLVHSAPPAQAIAQEVFDSVDTLNFQFCPQLLDPVKSGWRLGPWIWPSLEFIDFTACLLASPALIKEMLSTCPNLKRIVLNQCQSIDDSLAEAILGRSLEQLELAFCHIGDDFFDRLSEEDLPMESLRTLNIHGCVDVTDDGLAKLCSHAHSLTSFSFDACPKLHDIRPLKKLKKLTTLRLTDSTAPEPRLKEVLKFFLPKLHHLDIGCTLVTDATFEFLCNESAPLCEMITFSLRKTKLTRTTLEWIGYKMPKLESLNITANDFGHGFGKHVKFEKLRRFECGLDKYTSGCDTAVRATRNEVAGGRFFPSFFFELYTPF